MDRAPPFLGLLFGENIQLSLPTLNSAAVRKKTNFNYEYITILSWPSSHPDLSFVLQSQKDKMKNPLLIRPLSETALTLFYERRKVHKAKTQSGTTTFSGDCGSPQSFLNRLPEKPWIC